MTKFEYKFTCLDGYYNLSCDISDKLIYNIDTTIDSLVSKSGEIDKTDFIESINKVNIRLWDRYYNATSSSIEDATKWYVKCIIDDSLYESEGEESYEPYNYYELIEAICHIDKNGKYFKFED